MSRRETQKNRQQILLELKAGHLGMAMQIAEEGQFPIEGDTEIRKAAVLAAEGSLKRNFHWILPAFIAAFKIEDSLELQQVAYKVAALALGHQQFLLAGLLAQTFNLNFDRNILARIEQAKNSLIASIQNSEAVVIDSSASEYSFNVE
jgi:hypothetical protein